MLAVRATHHAGFQIVAAPPKATPRKGEILIKNIFVASNPKGLPLKGKKNPCREREGLYID